MRKRTIERKKVKKMALVAFSLYLVIAIAIDIHFKIKRDKREIEVAKARKEASEAIRDNFTFEDVTEDDR